MRKYLGSKVTAFASITAPLFASVPLLLGVCVLCSEISAATVFLASGGFACSLLWGVYIQRKIKQFYSWGIFLNDKVQIITGLFYKSSIQYEKCRSCGIGFYTHGLLNTKVGTKIWFIFLSYDLFDEHFRSNINLWEPSTNRIKVQFSKELYDYLLTVLPRKQSKMLSQDYKKYFG